MSDQRVLAVSGSLRSGSYNSALVRAAIGRASANVEFDLYEELSTLPMYDQDRDGETVPGPVRALRERVLRADGLIIATPEHNASIPAALKNAIDWVSTVSPGLFEGKPTAVMGASPGALGAARAQTALRQILTSVGAEVLVRPEVIVFRCAESFDAAGNLCDQTTSTMLGELVAALEVRTRILSGTRQAA